jgi:hypothetical protein
LLNNHRKKIIWATLVVLFAFMVGTRAYAVTETKILPSDGATGDRFGAWYVSLNGNTALIGAYLDDDNGADSGSAYIFRYNGSDWVQEQKLLATDGAANDEFGRALSVNGDTAFVGSWLDDDNGADSGSVYVFRWNGSSWVEDQKLLATDGDAGDGFGRYVDIKGSLAVVGAHLDDDNGDASGSAYVFRNNGINWVEEQKLTASDGAAGDRFGFTPSISGDVVVVGAPYDDDIGDGSGSAYVFRYNGINWVEEQKLIASDGFAGARLGEETFVDGNTILVSCSRDDDRGADSGSVYVFLYDGISWKEVQKLIASDTAAGDLFSSTPSISGDVAVMGAHMNDDNGSQSGSAYVFRWNGSSWVEEQKLLASDGDAGDYFGGRLSISGNFVLVSASRNDDNGNDSGSVYIYDISTPLGDDGGG